MRSAAAATIAVSHLTFLSIKWHAYSSSSSNAYSKNTLSYTYFCYTSIHSHPELTFQWKTLSALFLGALLVISSGGYWLLALKVTSWCLQTLNKHFCTRNPQGVCVCRSVVMVFHHRSKPQSFFPDVKYCSRVRLCVIMVSRGVDLLATELTRSLKSPFKVSFMGKITYVSRNVILYSYCFVLSYSPTTFLFRRGKRGQFKGRQEVSHRSHKQQKSKVKAKQNVMKNKLL